MLFLEKVLGWSEVWALSFPLAVLLRYPKQPYEFKPVIIYLCLALCINLLIDTIAHFKDMYHFPPWFQSNNFLYNTHSIFRLVCFSSFFILLPQLYKAKLKKLLLVGFLLFVVINFSFYEKFFYYNSFSSHLLATEAAVLLCYCLQYYFLKMYDDSQSITKSGDYWIVTGLSIYVVVNFFYFLFYKRLIKYDVAFAMLMWNFHNVTYVIMNLFIAKAFYKPIYE